MTSATINGVELYPMDVWMERTDSYGHYLLCLMNDDGTITTKTVADSENWDRYNEFDEDQAEEAFTFLIDHYENKLAEMIKA